MNNHPGKPDDRVSEQVVKFVNKDNYYRGTFAGVVSAESLSITNGKFDDILITNATLSGVTLKTLDGSDIDLNVIADDIQEISSEVHEKVIFEVSTHIPEEFEEVENKFTAVSSEFVDLSNSLSAFGSKTVIEGLV